MEVLPLEAIEVLMLRWVPLLVGGFCAFTGLAAARRGVRAGIEEAKAEGRSNALGIGLGWVLVVGATAVYATVGAGVARLAVWLAFRAGELGVWAADCAWRGCNTLPFQGPTL